MRVLVQTRVVLLDDAGLEVVDMDGEVELDVVKGDAGFRATRGLVLAKAGQLAAGLASEAVHESGIAGSIS